MLLSGNQELEKLYDLTTIPGPPIEQILMMTNFKATECRHSKRYRSVDHRQSLQQFKQGHDQFSSMQERHNTTDSTALFFQTIDDYCIVFMKISRYPLFIIHINYLYVNMSNALESHFIHTRFKMG